MQNFSFSSFQTNKRKIQLFSRAEREDWNYSHFCTVKNKATATSWLA